MADPIAFQSREAKLNMAIEAEVKRIADVTYELPGADAPIVTHFVSKIEGNYDVSRAKKDTDHAVELLYIAYNTTPLTEDAIRAKIVRIMEQLIAAQQDSQRAMSNAMGKAHDILGSIADVFPDWLDIKADADPAEIKAFVGKDLVELANTIQGEALVVQASLLAIAKTYDGILADASAATADSERALSTRDKAKELIQKEINAANADRARLEDLVKGLQEEVEKFEDLARKYEARADDAEMKAFIMSILRVAAEMVAAAMPAIAMAVGGPGSMLAAQTLNTVTKVAGVGDDKDTGKDKAKDEAATKVEVSRKQAELKASEKRAAEIKGQIKALDTERTKLVEKARPAADAPAPAKPEESGASPAPAKPEVPPAVPAPAKPEPAATPEIAALDERIATAKKDLEKEEATGQAIANTLLGLKASLDSLAANMGKMSDEQQSQAAALRKMQMQMLDKAEAYERERRNQSAELVKIKVLLSGQRSEEETIQLTIKSLALSITALKRVQQILEEIAFFFKSFADFMGQVAKDAAAQVKRSEAAAASETLRRNRLASLIETTDAFFIKQTAEWHAAAIVSDRFNQSFADGWSKLSKRKGQYKFGDELTAYFATASALIAEIVEEREASSARRIADIGEFRKQLDIRAA